MGADHANWDFIIVGGGPAGCALACRLSADPRMRVLLLDAGRSDRHPFSRVPAAVGLAISSHRMNWHYLAEPDPSRLNRIDMWPAGKLLGGGSSINGMMFVRGHRWDYDHWASLGNPGWDYAGVLPYFRLMEHNERGADAWRGQGGPVWASDVRIRHPVTDAFVAGMVELGVVRNPDLNGESQEGVDYCQVSQRGGWRQSAARAYLEPVAGRRNLEVRLGSTVTSLVIEKHRASGVRYQRNGREHIARATRGVILSAGALASPKILLQSGVGPADELAALGVPLRHELPGVGRNLQEHVGMVISAHVNIPTLSSDLGLGSLLRNGWRFLTRREGAVTNPVGHAHAFVRTREGLPAPNVQIIISPMSFDHHEGGATLYRQPAVNLAVGLCRSRARGRLRLRSADPSTAPVIESALLSQPEDVQDLLEGVRFARRLFSTRAFGQLFVDERKPGTWLQTDAELADALRAESFLMYHPCGTCAMGQGREAVVDERLRVRGLDGLRVADASIMPTVPSGNINASVCMIGEKASDLILQDITDQPPEINL